MQWLFHTIVDKNWECNHVLTQLLIWIKNAMTFACNCWQELGMQQLLHIDKIRNAMTFSPYQRQKRSWLKTCSWKGNFIFISKYVILIKKIRNLFNWFRFLALIMLFLKPWYNVFNYNDFSTQLLTRIKKATTFPHNCWYELGMQQLFHLIKDGKKSWLKTCNWKENFIFISKYVI